MDTPKDYYEVLGVDRSASAEQIRKAYRKLARQLHPDVNKAPDAAKRFGQVQDAYDILSDAEKRKSYDRFGHAGVGAGFASGAAGAGGAGPGWGGFGGSPRSQSGGGRTVWTGDDINAGDLNDIFSQVFGSGSPFGTARGARGAGARAQPQRGQDVEHTLTITFLTAALGGTEHIRLGMGAAGHETISVKIPAGIESGAKLRVRGKGHPGQFGGAAGDIILNIQVGQHPYLRREALDLLIDVPITIAETVLGTTVTVPLLGGGSVDLKVPPGTSSGKKLRVKGKGIADGKGKRGDFYVVIQIVAPPAAELSEKHRKLLGELEAQLQNPRESAPWAADIKARSA